MAATDAIRSLAGIGVQAWRYVGSTRVTLTASAEDASLIARVLGGQCDCAGRIEAGQPQ